MLGKRERITVSEQITELNWLYPNTVVMKYPSRERDTRASEVTIIAGGESLTVFMDS